MAFSKLWGDLFQSAYLIVVYVLKDEEDEIKMANDQNVEDLVL